MPCNLSFIVKNIEVLKITGSHVHFKSGSVLKTVLDKDVETTVHKQEVIYAIRPFNSSNCDDLRCMSRSFIDCKLFYTDKRVTRSQFLVSINTLYSLLRDGRTGVIDKVVRVPWVLADILVNP